MAIAASVTVHVEVFDAQGAWDHALADYQKHYTASDEVAVAEFVDICGPREDPNIGELLRMIFDPGESPPGISIQDSSAEVPE